jgi:hypothetical protein
MKRSGIPRSGKGKGKKENGEWRGSEAESRKAGTEDKAQRNIGKGISGKAINFDKYYTD